MNNDIDLLPEINGKKFAIHMIDAILEKCPQRGKFSLDEMIVDIIADFEDIDAFKTLPEQEFKMLKHLLDRLRDNVSTGILKPLYDHGYINNEDENPVFLTGEGLMAKRVGGHFKYIAYLKDKEETENKIKALSIRTNESVKSTNLVQKISLIVTGIFIIAGVIIQCNALKIAKDEYTLHKSDPKDIKPQEKPEPQVIKELNDLKGRLNAIQKRLDSVESEGKKKKRP